METIMSEEQKTQNSAQVQDKHTFAPLHIVNPGNPMFSCDKRFTKHASTLVTEPKLKEKTNPVQHPMYITTSNSYGSLQSTVDTCPNSFHGRSQKFSEHLARAGNYRNNSLNTSTDKSNV